MLRMLKQAEEEANARTNGVIDMGVFVSLLSIAQSVGINRPDNFVKYVTGESW